MNSEDYKSNLESMAIKSQEKRYLEAEERFLIDRAIRRKYGEAVGDAKSEAARLRELAYEIGNVADNHRFLTTVSRSNRLGSSPTHSNAET